MRSKKNQNAWILNPPPRRRHRGKKIFVFVASFFIALTVVFLWWAVGTELPREAELAVGHHAQYEPAMPKAQLKVVTYNIGFGQGIKSSPMDWRDEDLTRRKLGEIAGVIARLDPDVLFLQEVDLESNRSHYINEADFLIEKGRFPYSACGVVWDKNYVPFPFWPPALHIGSIKTANCVLSKYPMVSHQRIIFDKPKSNPFWYNWGYLDRGAQKIEIRVGDRSLTVVNLHLEAYEEEAREVQAQVLLDWIKDVQGPLVIGGDFNAIPSGAPQVDNFADEPGISYATDTTLEIIKNGLKSYSQAIPDSTCRLYEALCLTFRADTPSRQLDHLFASGGARFLSGNTDFEARDASDHLPIVGILEL